MAPPVEMKRRGSLMASLTLGTTATILFYLAIQNDLMRSTTIYRYTTGHPIEYATLGMFFWAMADLLLKFRANHRQWPLLQKCWLPPYAQPQPADTAEELLYTVQSGPPAFVASRLGQRLRDALHYVREKRSADTLEGHLQNLADEALEHVHDSYAFVRLSAWMIPILGFLGTVVGITLAIANISPTQLENSLPEVTGGLAVAFDTTALSLMLAMILMATNFLVERAEQAFVTAVSSYTDVHLAHRFARTADQNQAPYLTALKQTGEAILGVTQRMVQHQVELWAQTVTLLERQQQENTRRLDEHLQRSLAALQAEWKSQGQLVANTLQRTDAVQQDLGRITEALKDVLSAEGSILNLQHTLTNNLQILQQTQSIDQAVNTLTAAVHLLTLRNAPALAPAKPAPNGRAA